MIRRNRPAVKDARALDLGNRSVSSILLGRYEFGPGTERDGTDSAALIWEIREAGRRRVGATAGVRRTDRGREAGRPGPERL